MPICYDISIELIRTDDTGDETVTSLPLKLRESAEVANEYIAGKVGEHLEQFLSWLGDTAPDRANQYRGTGEFVVTAVYNC